MMRSRYSWALILFAFVLVLTGTSKAANDNFPQSPSQIKPEQKKSTSGKKPSPTYLRGTEDKPVFMKGEITTKRSEEDIATDIKEREHKTALDTELVEYTKLLAYCMAGLIVTALGQIGLFLWQLRLMRQATTDAGSAAEAAKASAEAAIKQAESIVASDRAYVKMSHSPPGREVSPGPSSKYGVQIEVKNLGRTPATVTGMVLIPLVLPNTTSLPTIPDYSSAQNKK